MSSPELEVALEAVYSAIRISRRVQAELTVGQWGKADASPVTVADLAVQAQISATLREHFPNIPLMAEESSEELTGDTTGQLLEQVTKEVAAVRGGSLTPQQVQAWIERGQETIDPEKPYWILDPIDGTKGFLRREQYAIALALVERGKILLGVLACPNLPQDLSSGGILPGYVYFAERGQGAELIACPPEGTLATATRSALQVSPVSDPAQGSWCERVESSDNNKDITTQIIRQAGITAEALRLDSQAKYAVVARGETAVYLRHSLKPYVEKVWDHAAGVIVMEEAGGRVTDVHGKPLNFALGRTLADNKGVLATNGALHDRILAAAATVLNQ